MIGVCWSVDHCGLLVRQKWKAAVKAAFLCAPSKRTAFIATSVVAGVRAIAETMNISLPAGAGRVFHNLLLGIVRM